MDELLAMSLSFHINGMKTNPVVMDYNTINETDERNCRAN